jgi:hypothetical protein
MIIRYTNDKAEKREFPFRPYELRSVEGELIEAAGAGVWDTFDGWDALFRRGHKRAERVGLWVCLRRENNALQLHEVDVSMGSIVVALDLGERREQRQQIRKEVAAGKIQAADGDRILAAAWLALPDGEVEDTDPLPPSVEPGGKPPSPLDDDVTGGPSAATST